MRPGYFNDRKLRGEVMLTNFRIIRSLRLLVGSVIFYSFAANSDDPHIDIVLGFAGMAEYADAVMADETADHVNDEVCPGNS